MNFQSIILLLVLYIRSAQCDTFSKIMRLCEDGSCDVSKEEYETLTANKTEANERMYKFVSAGLPQIFWDQVKAKRDSFRRTGKHEFEVSTICSQSLYQVADGLDNADLWAYRSKLRQLC